MASVSKSSLSLADRDILEFLNSSFSSLEILETKLDSVLASEVDTLNQLESELDSEKREAKINIEQLQEKCSESSNQLAELQSNYPLLQKEISTLLEEPEWSKELASEYRLAERSEAALGFLYFAKKSLTICAQAESDSKSATTAQLDSYEQLVDCVNFLRRQTGQTHFYSLHLQEHLETKALRVNLHIQKSLTKYFEQTLDEMSWPQEVDLHKLAHESPELLKKFRTQFKELEKFQKCSNEVNPVMNQITTHRLPLDIMIKAIVIRFHYHFMGPRPTNTLERPEWFLTYILDNITWHLSLMGHLQVQQLFLSAMAQLVHLKLRSVLDIVSKPPHLPRFAKELLEFDHAVASVAPHLTWEGCARFLLGDDERFYLWLSEEQRVVEHRLDEILRAPDTWEHINSTDGSLDSDRPTIAADRVASLFEAILARYVHLRPIHLQIRYFAQVHLGLVQNFHQELMRAINRYEKRITGFRPPGAPHVDYFPASAISRMTGIIDSIQFFIALLQDYDTQPFFLELWEVIKSPASGAGLFEELIVAYSKLAKKAINLIGDGLAREFSRDLRPWTILNTWSDSLHSGEAELTTALSTLTNHLRLTTQLHTSAQHKAIQGFASKLEDKLLKLIPANKVPLKVVRDVSLILDEIAPFYPDPVTLFPNLEKMLNISSYRSENDSLI